MHKKYEITNQDRVEFLKCYNKLRETLENIQEMNDLWLSDIQNLHDLRCLMAQTLAFSEKRNEEGNIEHYRKWVFSEDNVNKPNN